MKYIKLMGLFAVVAAFLMVFVGTASATTLTSPSGTTYTGTVHAESEGITTLHGPATIECEVSTVSGKVEAHGSSVTASGTIATLTFEKCNQHLTVLRAGELIVHTDNAEKVDGNGRLTSNGAEITLQITGLVSCLFSTNNTYIGTITGSDTKHATLDIDSVSIPRTGHSIFCGSTYEWTGSYTITTPSTLTVD